MLTPKLERGYTSAQWTPGRGGAIQLSEIKVRENETFESALRRFNKKIKQNGVLAAGSHDLIGAPWGSRSLLKR